MNNQDQDVMFTKKDLVRLIVPLVIEQILAVTIGIADTVMVSSCGEAAVSGISLVDSIAILLINIFSALAGGGAVVAAQYLGRRDRENAGKAAGQLMTISVGIAAAVMILCFIGRRALLSLIFGNIEESVMNNALIYFFISALSFPFLAAYNGGAALFRSMRNSQISMITSLIMNLINVAGNALLIFGFHMGVAGAALATLVARVAGAVIMLVLLRNEENVLSLRYLHQFKLEKTMVRNILRIGVPNGLENGMFQMGKILVQSLIASFGTAAIAANAISGNVVQMEIIPGTAMGLVMITVVGQCIGAREYEQVKKYTYKLMGITCACMGIISVIILLTCGTILKIYNVSAEATEMAKTIIMLHSIMCIVFWPLSFTLPNMLRASNDARFTMMVSVISMWSTRIGLSYLFGAYFGWGLTGVWIAMMVDWVVRATAFVVRFLSGKWKLQKGI